MKTAVVIGATGLVGKELVHLLLKDSRFKKVLTFVRRSSGIKDEKLEEHIIDFEKPATWQHLVKGDVFYSALGTTIKQAGSQKAQFNVDYTYQFNFARAAASNGIPVYVLISSSGANPDSVIFYTRMKGELERDIKKLTFESIYLLQPGLLAGKREKERPGEIIGYKLLKIFNAIGLFRKYRPVQAKAVGQAMINAGTEAAPGIHTVTADKVFILADK